MAAPELPDSHNVVRYVGAAGILDNGQVDGSQFCRRPGEDGFSVNWLEYFDRPDKAQQIAEIRRVIHLRLGRQAVFAELNAGDIREQLRARLPAVLFVNTPQPPDDRFPYEDPSHSDICGLPPGDSDAAALIGDLIARRVKALHPATLPEE